MVAGGTFPRAYWTCDGESDAALESRKRSIPDCGDGGEIKLHVFFPSCWDGKNLDSSDHRRHVVYGLDADGHAADIEAERRRRPIRSSSPSSTCASSTTSKTAAHHEALGRAASRRTPISSTPGWTRTWSDWVRRCLGRAGRSCGLIDGVSGLRRMARRHTASRSASGPNRWTFASTQFQRRATPSSKLTFGFQPSSCSALRMSLM